MFFSKKTTTRFSNSRVLSGTLIIGLLFACASNLAISATTTLPEWNYDDKAGTGPSYWGTLTTADGQLAYETCGTGREQSPIDLTNPTFKNTDDIDTHYKSWSLNVENNGHTIQINMAPGSTLDIEGETYYLLQFHFHGDSEHTVNGGHEPVEMHFVHMNSKGELAVLGVFIEEDRHDKPNAQIAAILQLAPEEVGKNNIAHNVVKASELLPGKSIDSFWYYHGSLTTPPCTEGVKWYVAKEHIYASHEQIEGLKELLQHHGIPTPPHTTA
ncbi:MAG: carbonic anhydrase family protein [Gammaproteobacteria bacterium]|jgi:carbonic anhydrase